jgi:hypothetical protein
MRARKQSRSLAVGVWLDITRAVDDASWTTAIAAESKDIVVWLQETTTDSA